MKEDRRNLTQAAIGISLLTAVVLLLAREQGLLQPLELTGYDLGLTLRPGTALPSPVTLIEITEPDISAIGRWPVSDGFMAAALERILARAPRVVGLDIYRDVAVPPGTEQLSNLFSRQQSVIGILKFHSAGSTGVAGPAALVAADQVGFSDILLDADGVVRRGLAFLDDGEIFRWAFALKLALAFLEDENVRLTPDEAHPENFQLGPTPIAPLSAGFGGYVGVDDAGYQFLIDYRRRLALPTFTVAELMADEIPEQLLNDRIVILGVNAESVKDSFLTPISRWPWAASPQIPGIALHGLIADQLIRNGRGETRPMHAFEPLAEALLLLGACLAGGIAGLLARSVSRLALVVGAGVVGVTGIGLLLFVGDYWFPVLPLATGWTASATLVTAYLVQKTRKDRLALQRILNLQVSEAVADEIWRQREELLHGGAIKPQHLRATVMFVDLQGFTRRTEELPVDDLLDWLNPFMSLATETIIEHGGMVDDYFGDGIKANFGMPIPRASDVEVKADAEHAISCAAELVSRVQALPAGPYVLRFGIHSGPVVAASVGSRERSKYTSVGDTVNVAARLEAIAKETAGADGHSRIVASETTVQLAGSNFRWRELGPVTLKGRTQPVLAHELEL